MFHKDINEAVSVNIYQSTDRHIREKSKLQIGIKWKFPNGKFSECGILDCDNV